MDFDPGEMDLTHPLTYEILGDDNVDDWEWLNRPSGPATTTGVVSWSWSIFLVLVFFAWVIGS